MKHLSTKVIIAGLAFTITATGAATAYSGQNLAKDARISLQQAEAIALRTVPGKIVAMELERERGGSGLRYSFDVKVHAGVTREVGVDAKTGKVIENIKEGKNPD